MSIQLTETQISEIKEVFDLFEVNGQLSVDQIGSAMSSLNRDLSPEKIRDIMSSSGMDTDALDFNQFLNFASVYYHHERKDATLLTEKELVAKQIFMLFDHNNDGHIEASELTTVMGQLGNETSEDEARNLIKEVDLDGDGKISLQEFLAYIKTKNM